eukprot:COSAG01_NODE_14004_length_1509_cov_0.983688_1_plen_66_part_10
MIDSSIISTYLQSCPHSFHAGAEALHSALPPRGVHLHCSWLLSRRHGHCGRREGGYRDGAMAARRK